MTVSVLHTKVVTIADEQLAVQRGEVVPSDWNDAHTLVGITELDLNVRGLAVIDMNNADYTMTDHEAQCSTKVIINGGSGKTLTSPTTSDGLTPAFSSIVMAFTANPIYYQFQTDLDPILIVAPNADIVASTQGATPLSFYNQNVSDTAFSASWNGDLMVPTKNAVYDAIKAVDNSYNQSFLLMGG
jgi:hypothetical protein